MIGSGDFPPSTCPFCSAKITNGRDGLPGGGVGVPPGGFVPPSGPGVPPMGFVPPPGTLPGTMPPPVGMPPGGFPPPAGMPVGLPGGATPPAGGYVPPPTAPVGAPMGDPVMPPPPAVVPPPPHVPAAAPPAGAGLEGFRCEACNREFASRGTPSSCPHCGVRFTEIRNTDGTTTSLGAGAWTAIITGILVLAGLIGAAIKIMNG